MTTLSDYITDNISESILSSTHTGKAHLDEELKKYGLDPAKAKFNADGSIDYNGDVEMNSIGLTKLPFKFRKVNGYFDISYNNLTSLEGCPEEVKDSLFCDKNQLISLKGGPKRVNGAFFCEYNNLTTLEGAPNIVAGGFNCSYNNLTNLKGGPEQVGYDYDCSYNNLTSLEGLPKKLKNILYCHDNPSKFNVKDVLAVCNMDKNKIFV